MCLSYSVVTALREAITSARTDSGITEWFEMGKLQFILSYQF